MGLDAEHRGNNGDGEMQAVAGESEGETADETDATDATREGGEGERQWKQRQAHNDTFGGRRDDRG